MRHMKTILRTRRVNFLQPCPENLDKITKTKPHKLDKQFFNWKISAEKVFAKSFSWHKKEGSPCLQKNCCSLSELCYWNRFSFNSIGHLEMAHPARWKRFLQLCRNSVTIARKKYQNSHETFRWNPKVKTKIPIFFSANCSCGHKNYSFDNPSNKIVP